VKPTITWIILANANQVRVISNAGPNKGLSEVEDVTWQAPERPDYADEPGVTQSSAGPGRASITRPDTKHLAEQEFANSVVDDLEQHHRKGRFDRLLLIGAPHMLGSLRKSLTPRLQKVVVAEVAKDLIQISLSELPAHLTDQLAV